MAVGDRRLHAKFYRMARAVAYVPTHHDEERDFYFPEGRSVQFCLMFLVPIIFGLKISNYSRYEAFITGKDSSALCEVLANMENDIGMLNDLLSDHESFHEVGQTGQRKTVKLEDKLNAVYDALFIKQYNNTYEVKIGQMSFRASTKENLLRAVSALSKYADFDV